MESEIVVCGITSNDFNEVMCGQAEDVFIPADAADEQYTNYLKPDSSGVLLPRKSSLIKDANQRHSNKKKTVSFSSSSPDDKTIACASDCLCFMQDGSEFIKVRSSGRQYKRLFLISSDFQEITWHPSSKKPNKARISVDQIKEIRRGRDTPVLKGLRMGDCSYNEGCFFSIITGDSFESLDLIATSPDEANIWITGLTFLKLKKDDGNHAMEKPLRDKWLENMFVSADIHGIGKLSDEEVAHLMKKINSNLSSRQIQRMLKEVCRGKEGDRRLTSSEFVNVFKKISTRPDILFLFVRYAKEIDYMMCEEFMTFAETEQGITGLTPNKCKDIIDNFEPSVEGRQSGHLGFDGFSSYITSDECTIFDPNHSLVYQDMRQPLSHYFIASSYNTYFLKESMTSFPTAEGFTFALEKGCRFITVDCWDGPDNDPVVRRGKVPSTNLLFRKVIETINEYAFSTSVYPVIINLVNHCNFEQQDKMMEIMKAIFKDKLCSHDDLFKSQSSPEDLKFKIILMSKKVLYIPIEEDDDNLQESYNCTLNEEFFTLERKLGKEMSHFVHFNLISKTRDFDFLTLKDCSVVILLNESSALKLSNIRLDEFVQHNKMSLTVICPNMTRLDSSNYHPQDFWNCGCQIVSMNYQTSGAMMDLNDGMFQQNGSCGYVLKPAVMRDEIGSIKADSRGFIPGISPQILYIRILSATNLPKPEGSSAKGTTLDPYVTIEIVGIPSDCTEQRTRTIQHLETSTTGPMFDESFEFELNLPDLAMVRFSVLDDEYMGDDFIGQCTIPVVCMRSGYRHVPLKSSSGDIIKDCFLFVHIAIDNKKKAITVRKGSLLGKKKSTDQDFRHVKMIGLKIVDDVFKSSTSSMKEASELLSRLHSSFYLLRDSCGPAGVSNMKQIIKQFIGRIQRSTDNVIFEVQVRNGYPILEVSGNVPDVIRKSIYAFEMFIMDNINLQSRADEIIHKLLSCRTSAMEFHEDLANLLSSNGIKGRKLNKAIETYTWNIRVLKGQEDLIGQATLKSVEHIRQILETSEFLGIIKKETEHCTSQSPESTTNVK